MERLLVSKHAVVLLAALSLLQIYSVHAYSQVPARFKHLTTADGLSNNQVTDILQDHHGFLWIATNNGLSRYDGYAFQVYRHSFGDPQGLKSSAINSLFLDSKDRLWVGTANGLHQFNFHRLSFRHHDSPQNQSDWNVRSIAETADGNLIIGSESGLLQLDPESGDFSAYFAPEHPNQWLNDASINAVLMDRSNSLWIGTETGLYRHSKSNGRVIAYVHVEGNPNSLVEGSVLSLFEDKSGHIWIGIDGGLSQLDPVNNRVWNYYHEDDGGAADQLVGDEVLDVTQDDQGIIWIATTEGLNRYDAVKKVFTPYFHHPDFADSLAHSQTTSLYIDRSGILWTGTAGGGLSRLNLKRKPFHHAQHQPGKSDSLGYDSVLSFKEDGQGRLWVGLDDEGFNRFDPETGDFERFEYEAEDYPTTENQEGIFYIDSGGIHKDRIRSIEVDSTGNLWMGTSEGLEYFNLESIQFRHFSPKEDRPHSLSAEDILVVRLTAPEVLWLGTDGGGLIRFNPKTYETKIYRHQPGDPTSLSGDTVTAILPNGDGKLWIATKGAGLNLFDSNSEQFKSWRSTKTSDHSLSHDNVWSLHLSGQGNLWIGTDNGLNRLNPATEKIEHFGENEGITAPIILGILEDNSGNLWLSKERGVSKFNPALLTVRNYSSRNGLPTDQFLHGAYYKSSTGQFYLGSNQGMVFFDPEMIEDNSHQPKLLLTGLQIFNKSIIPGDDSPLDSAVSEAKKLHLTWRDKVVSFTFSALDFTNPENNLYQYKLEGFDLDWSESNRRRVVSYTNLPAGTYLFRVRGSNNDGIWSDNEIALAVEVAPPPWQTWWAYSIYLILTAATLIAVIWYRTLKLRKALAAREKANLLLEQKVADRTNELNLKNLELEKSNRNIISSIQYAQKIQHALLPSDSLVKQLFDDCFIVWQPRDIVGGDVYYIDQLNGFTVVAVIDCTGHGVPGAFMTMLASSGLRRITVDENCLNPSEILTRLNMIVKKSLQQDSDHVRSDDGMDAAVCVVSPEQKELTFAGANLPLTYAYQDQIHAIKGDRHSIGYKKSDMDYQFTNHTVAVEKDMVFYLYTDGITDQLGGQKRRMFGNRRLREALLKRHQLPFDKQKEEVVVEFDNYRSDHTAQDDFTLIGFRIR